MRPAPGERTQGPPPYGGDPETPFRSSYTGRFDLAGWHLCHVVVRLRKTLGTAHPTLIDLGMGRGRDMIFLARRGYSVTGIDLDEAGIEKARRRATRMHVPLRALRADLRTFPFDRRYHVVFASSSLNHLPASIRAARFHAFQRATVPGGFHAINAFVRKPHLPRASDLGEGAREYRSGELLRYYSKWTILESGEVEFVCEAGGLLHRHALDVVVARKPLGARERA
jgi:tellurite methyltransferase